MEVGQGGDQVGETDGGDILTNIQCKPIWNCHNESPRTTNLKKKFFLKTSRYD
jgi:hypothetical protein